MIFSLSSCAPRNVQLLSRSLLAWTYPIDASDDYIELSESIDPALRQAKAALY